MSPTIGGFNPSKTFGGDRARIMFPLKNEFDDTSEKKDFNFTKDFSINKK
jgi:hypothetical protein